MSSALLADWSHPLTMLASLYRTETGQAVRPQEAEGLLSPDWQSFVTLLDRF